MLAGARAVVSLFTQSTDASGVQTQDPELMRLAAGLLKGLGKYFRVSIEGLENMPEGKALIVGNHNSGVTFLEPMFLGAAWYKKSGGLDDLFYLAHDAMVALPVVGNLLTKLGSIRASHQTATDVFDMNRKVVVFPGGNYEAFRPFKDRHKVDFGGKKGFLRLAMKNQVPIVPLLSIGGHETFYVLHRGEKLAELLGVKKYLRSESFPLFLGLPWGIGVGPIFHLPLPSKCTVELGKPISVAGFRPEDASDPVKLAELYNRVQGTLQKMMDRHAAKRKRPLLG